MPLQELLRSGAEDHIGGWFNLGPTLSRQGQNERAEACYRRAVELGGGPLALNNLVAIQRVLGRFSEAQTTLDRLVQESPASVNFYDQVRGDVGVPSGGEALASVPLSGLRPGAPSLVLTTVFPRSRPEGRE